MTIVEARDRADLEAKVGDRTAMIAVLAEAERQAQFAPPLPKAEALLHGDHVLKAEEFVEIGRSHDVPVLVDMASDLPPWDNFTRFIQAGADLVVISGGKGIGGPQATGILAGRSDLIESARMQFAPNDHIGRGMKVGKEEIIGLVVALERFVDMDHAGLVREWNRRSRWLADQLQGIQGLTAEYSENTSGYGDVALSWDPSVVPMSPDQVKAALLAGEPSVAYLITVRTRLLREGEERLVAGRLRAFFEGEARQG